jgi:hypothetical protein
MRAAAIAALALGLAWVVTAASDEGGLAWGERAGRTLPFAPVCAAVGAWLALAPARTRGEDRALAAIGRSPWQRHAAAILGGSAVALVAAAAIAAPAVDVRGFYPRPEARATWHADGDGFASSDGRWRVDARGEPSPLAGGSVDVLGPRPLPRAARASASLATAALGIALPMLAAAARRRTVARVIGGVLVTAMAMVLAFQAAAASRASPLLAPLPPLLLLAAAASLYSLSPRPWRRAKSPK